MARVIGSSNTKSTAFIYYILSTHRQIKSVPNARIFSNKPVPKGLNNYWFKST